MRIAFIVPEFPSLSQTFVLNQIIGLLNRGHDVKIFAAGRTTSEKCHHDILKYDLLSRTTYLPQVPLGRLHRMLKGLQLALAYFPKYPKTVLQSLNIFKFGRLAASFTLMFYVVPFLGKGPFHIIHCHFGPFGNLGVQCLRTGALKGKLVTAFHGYDLTSYPKKHGRQIYTTLFEHCDLCLPISNHWKGRLIEMGCRPERIVVHRMGVDLEDFNKLSKAKAARSGSTKILSVARLTEKKGIQYAIEAVSKVLEHFPDVEYSIAGDGPLKPQLEQLIKLLKLEKHVHLLGWMNQQEVTELMCQADILLAPSITASDGDQEGIPVVLMEALAMELPVVSTFHSGIPELIVDGHSGLLVPERDASALANKLIELISNESLAGKLKANGKSHIAANYNIHTLNTQLEQLYAGLSFLSF